ncbi:hypothetical protein LOZ51_005724, partial [Ophidiomyces ophidiicola]
MASSSALLDLQKLRVRRREILRLSTRLKLTDTQARFILKEMEKSKCLELENPEIVRQFVRTEWLTEDEAAH